MKKHFTLMMLLAIAGSASAELVLKTTSKIRICPNVLTTSGKSIVYTYSNGEVTVYTPDFLVDKTFKIPKQEYQVGRITEETKVTLTGVNAVPENEWGVQNYYTYYEFDASSQEEMISKLLSNYSWDTFTTFTDAMGNPACYRESASFKYSNIFGKQYPESWYALIDGKVYGVNTYDPFYSLAYDEASAVWTRTSEDIQTYTSSLASMDLLYEGMDGNIDGYLSQNLFNDDDKWEYLVYDYSGELITNYSNPRAGGINEDGTVTLTREGSIGPEDRGYAVYNEDGEKLGNIASKDICIINGKPYSYEYESLYSFDANGGDIDFIETVKAKDEHRLGATRGIVTVDISAEQAGGEVVVSTPDGKVLATKRVGIGQTQVNDQPLPTGIYVVSLLKDGKVVESEKYLVQ